MKKFTLPEAKKIATFGDIIMTIAVIISFLLGAFALYNLSFRNVAATVVVVIVLVINLVFSSVVYNMSYIFAINAENLYLIRQRICGEDTDIYNAAKPSDPLSTATSKEISQ